DDSGAVVGVEGTVGGNFLFRKRSFDRSNELTQTKHRIFRNPLFYFIYRILIARVKCYTNSRELDVKINGHLSCVKQFSFSAPRVIELKIITHCNRTFNNFPSPRVNSEWQVPAIKCEC